MIDHAHTIRQRIYENERMDEMERRTAPLFWLVYILAFVAFCWVIAFVACCLVIYEQKQMHKELASLKADFQTVQRGGIIGVGDNAVMACTVRKVIGEGI